MYFFKHVNSDIIFNSSVCLIWFHFQNFNFNTIQVFVYNVNTIWINFET